MTRLWIRAALLLTTVIALLIACSSGLLILMVLAGCLSLALVAECTLPKGWPGCRALIGGGLAGTFSAILITCLLPDAGLRVAPRGEIPLGDVFVAFALGLGEDSAPGLSNRAIARWIIANNPKRLPTITQEGVYRALKELEKSRLKLDVDSWTIRLPHDPLIYVNTREAAQQTQTILKEKGYRRPVLVSHDLQLQRMVWHFEASGLGEEIVVPDLPVISFDPKSIQHWGTRSRNNWVFVERFYSRPIMGRDRWVWLVAVLGALAGMAGMFWASRKRQRPE